MKLPLELIEFIYELLPIESEKDKNLKLLLLAGIDQVISLKETFGSIKKFNWISFFASDSEFVEAIMALGRLELIQYLIFDCHEIDHGEWVRLAARHGQLQILKWLHQPQTIQRLTIDCLFRQEGSELIANSLPAISADSNVNGLHAQVIPDVSVTSNFKFHSRCWGLGVETGKSKNMNSQNSAQNSHMNVPEQLIGHSMHCKSEIPHCSAKKWNRPDIRVPLKHPFCFSPPRNSTFAMDSAAENGHLDVLKYLYEQGERIVNDDVLDTAARNGHLEVVKYLTLIDTRCSNLAMDYAAMNGHLELVKFLHENRQEGCTQDAMNMASQNGHLAIVKYLHENRREGCTTKAMDLAAENGHLDVVVWLHENRSEGCTKWAMDGAAKNGHLNVIEWLDENRFEGCTIWAMDNAASNGHLEILDYLHKNRVEGYTNWAIKGAERNGHVKVLEWFQAIEG